MKFVYILLGVLAVAALLTLLIAYACFRIAFHSPDRKPADPNVFDIPKGDIYEPFRDAMVNWTKEARAMPHENVSVTSFDGLTLRGIYYEYAPGAPIELMFHGYRGNAERDLSGGVQRCFALGRSALIVDQRASGSSDGSVITMGIHEQRDCLIWLDFMLDKFGPDVKIILTGISMGASTVLMAASQPLPPNVIGILADCGYTSAKDIIRLIIRQMKLPPDLSYPFVKLGAKIFGGFDLDETSPIEAMKHCSVPVIFFHGEADNFVPCEMSRANFNACTAKKKLVTVPAAGHGLSFPLNQNAYIQAVWEFFGPEASADGFSLS
jgi:fermentation-respiration switch protein FrsA (DUF1100 family)